MFQQDQVMHSWCFFISHFSFSFTLIALNISRVTLTRCHRNTPTRYRWDEKKILKTTTETLAEGWKFINSIKFPYCLRMIWEFIRQRRLQRTKLSAMTMKLIKLISYSTHFSVSVGVYLLLEKYFLTQLNSYNFFCPDSSFTLSRVSELLMWVHKTGKKETHGIFLCR